MNQDEEGGGLPAFLADPRGVLRRRWPWLAVVGAVGVVATAIYVSQVPVTYLAQATLVVNEKQISDQFVANTMVEDPLNQLDAIVNEVLSRERLAPLVEKNHLYPKLREKTPMMALVAMARSNVVVATSSSVVPTKKGAPVSVFTVGFRDADPRISAVMANDLATLLTAAAGKATGEAVRTTADFMRAERDRSERELREQESLISDFKEKHRGELPTELSTNSAKLERLELQRQTTASQLDAAETRLADLEKLGDLANPSSPYARLASLRSKLVSELATNTEEHPNVIALRRQIEALEKEIAGGSRGNGDPSEDINLRTARDQVDDLKKQIAQLAAESAGLESHVSNTPQVDEQLQALTQKQIVLHDTYISNLRKLEAANLALSVDTAQQGTRVAVIDRASPPSDPEATRLKFLMVGLTGSVLAALGIAVLLELLDPVIVSAAQVEDELGLRVLGSIGRIG